MITNYTPAIQNVLWDVEMVDYMHGYTGLADCVDNRWYNTKSALTL